MTKSLRNVTGFEVRSVLLFTALSLGGASAMAQLQAPSQALQTSQAQQAPQPAMQSGPATGVQAAPPAAGSGDSVQAAFDRADTNQDGKLSKKEAESLPAVSSAFARIDTDKNGSLSREEFGKAVQQR